MSDIYPEIINKLPKFAGSFDARKLNAENCYVIFASYPKGTDIAPHAHETENVGIIINDELAVRVDGVSKKYHTGDGYPIAAKQQHAARFDEETTEIEYWFYA